MAEGHEFARSFKSLSTIYSNSWRLEQFLKKNAYEQLKNRSEQIIGMQKLKAYTNNGILLPKLFWPAARKNCSSDREKNLVTECFFNLFLEVSHIE